MTLCLVQHGESLSKEQDPERGLSAAGIATVERVAALAKQQGLSVDRILHSGKKRARQTAEILASVLRPPGGVHAETGLNPMDDATAYGDRCRNEDYRMLVGHLPFMEKLAAYLVTGSPDLSVCRFQNGGIVCLDRTAADDRWWIRWMLMPRL